MRGCSTSAAIEPRNGLRGQHLSALAANSLGPGNRMVWAIDLRRGAPVGRIAIEQHDGMADYKVLVDGVAVGRNSRVELALASAHRLEADPDRAARARNRAKDRSEAWR